MNNKRTPTNLVALIRWVAGKPIRVQVQESTAATPRHHTFYQPLRFGYDKSCDFYPDGESGPDVVFELKKERGLLRLSTPLDPEELRNHVDLSVNGEPLRGTGQELQSGSRVEIVDRSTKHRWNLIVDRPAWWQVRVRVLGITVLVLAIVGAGYGAYVYWVLLGTQTAITRTEERLAHTESELALAERQLREAVLRVESTQGRLVEAIEQFKAMQEASEREVRKEFHHRLDEINERARLELSRLSEHDNQARRKLEQETRASITALREELTEKMVEGYQRFKTLEERLFQSLASSVEAMALEGERFKHILGQAQHAIVFIRTSYQVEFTRSGNVSNYNSFGTGFLINSSGLGITAQHVLFPWRYERPFIVLEQLEVARVVPESVQWELWLTGEQVLKRTNEPPEFRSDTAYRNDWEDRAVHLVYAPPIDLAIEMVESPMGIVSASVPVPGRTDVSVFHIMDFSRHFEALDLSDTVTGTEPLDEVLVVGYPFSLLRDSVAIPQASRGFVRRLGSSILELDTALHPGLSGAPVLNREGHIIGMAVGILKSDVYGLAVRNQDLLQVLEQAVLAVQNDEERLMTLGCDPGAVDGRIDAQTWDAYRCEQRLESK